jgi:hypothetical protein
MKMIFRISCAELSLGVGVYILFLLITILLFEYEPSRQGAEVPVIKLFAGLFGLLLLWLTYFMVRSFTMPTTWFFNKEKGQLFIRERSNWLAILIYRQYPLQDIHDVKLEFEKRDAPIDFDDQKGHPRPLWTYYVGLPTLKVAQETITAPYGSWNLHRQMEKVNKLRKFLAFSPLALDVSFQKNVFRLAGYFFLSHLILLPSILVIFFFAFGQISYPILKGYLFFCLFLECGLILCATFDLLHLMVLEIRKTIRQIVKSPFAVQEAKPANRIEPKPPVMEQELRPTELKPGVNESESGTIDNISAGVQTLVWKSQDNSWTPSENSFLENLNPEPDTLEPKPKTTETESSSLSQENIWLVKEPAPTMIEGENDLTKPDYWRNGNQSTKETKPLLVSLSLYLVITLMLLRASFVLFGFLLMGGIFGLIAGGIITAASDEIGLHFEYMMGYTTTIVTLIFAAYLIQYQNKSLTELFLSQIMFDLYRDQKRKLKSFTYTERFIFLVLAPFAVVFIFLFMVFTLVLIAFIF